MMLKKILAALFLLCCIFGTAVAESMPAVVDERLDASPMEQPESIRQAQQYLIDLGLLDGGADGKFGPKTESALRAFQSREGYAVTGVLDTDTLDALAQAVAKNPSTRTIQQRLIDLGYLRGKADGIWGKRSAAALKLFQQFHGLALTERADQATLDRLFAEDAVTLPAALASGDKGDAVTRLQERLRDLAFFEDTVTGSYGKQTVAAVKAFQQHLKAQGYGESFDITANGEATPITQYFLFSESYSPYLRDLAPGATDSEVRRAELRLAQLGYMDQSADETLDDYALEALALFKAQAGLANGVGIDRTVADALFASDAPQADHCAPHDIAFGDSGMAVRDVEDALVRGGMLVKLPNGKFDKTVKTAVERLHSYLTSRKDPSAALFAHSDALSREAQQLLQDDLLGYRADVDGKKKNTAETTRVQRRLYSLYYISKSGVDGKFGSESRSAVKAFQAANGLPETGVADVETQAVLFSGDAAVKPWPYRVEVSIARQTVEIYRLNAAGTYDLANSFKCSTGLHNSTPRGIFLNGFPVNRWHYFQKFNCWAQYSFEITGDIMFHSVIYSSKSEKSLRRTSVSALGNPASHGCVRLQVEDAKWLFEHCKRGTVAIIIY